MSYDPEKKGEITVEKARSESISAVDQEYYDEGILDPPKEETLHRGLKARQISMIAVRSVRFSVSLADLVSCSLVARWARVLSLDPALRCDEQAH